MTDTLTTGELFAGVGGLGMAVDAVFGSRPVWFSEFDEAPSKVLEFHYPGIPNYGDVTPGVPRGGGLSGPRRRDRDGVSHRAMVSENCLGIST